MEQENTGPQNSDSQQGIPHRLPGDVDAPPPFIPGVHILEPLGKGSLGEIYLAERSPTEDAHLMRFRIGQDQRRLLILRERGDSYAKLCQDPVLAASLKLENRPGPNRYILEELHALPITEYCDRNEFSIDSRLKLFLQACEGVQSAHQRGLNHFDIRAGNVVIDSRFDQPRVRVLHLGLAANQRTEGNPHLSELGGPYLGSPHTMSPEQAGRGDQSPDQRSDVYSLGSLLFELLTGFPPLFPDLCTELPLEEMQRRVRDQVAPLASRALHGHPQQGLIAKARDCSPTTLLRRLHGDLDAILGRALERDRTRRYGSVQALADDLRRYRALRPIDARNENAIEMVARICKRRIALIGVLSIAIMAFALGYFLAPDQRSPERVITSSPETETISLRNELQRSTALILRLEASDLITVVAKARLPSHELPLTEQHDALLAWLGQHAEPLATKAAKLQAIITADHAVDDPVNKTLAAIRSCQAKVIAPQENRLQWVKARLDWLAEEDRYCFDDFADRWRSKLRAIAKDPLYGGLELLPQSGLIPLGRDPHSGLFEFYHPGSAGGNRSLPAPDERGALRIGGDSGIVMVLIPARTITLGAQGGDPRAANYDPNFQESPAHVPSIETTLPAFFISKYELTQGQWSRLAGNNPSLYQADLTLPSGGVIDDTHPVEGITWQAAWRVLTWTGLRMATEAEWEYAGRAGKEGKVFAETSRIEGLANLCDLSVARFKPWSWDIHRDLDSYPQLRSRWPNLEFMDDGYVLHAPVGSFGANDFGLHDMHGNLAEWCQGWIEAGAEDQRIARGDHFLSRRPSPIWKRDTLGQGAVGGQPHIGVRAARSIDR